MTALQRGGPRAERLRSRLIASTDQEVSITIISVEEQLRGWLEVIHQAKTPEKQVAAYDLLRRMIYFFQQWRVMPFDDAAASRLKDLQTRKLSKVRPMDLKIAAIALTHNAKLLTENLKDFRLVPGLEIEDWLTAE